MEAGLSTRYIFFRPHVKLPQLKCQESAVKPLMTELSVLIWEELQDKKNCGWLGTSAGDQANSSDS